MLGDVDPRPQLPELLPDLVGSLIDRGVDGCLRLVQRVEMMPSPRQTAGLRARLHAVNAAADLGELVFDGGCGGGQEIEPPVRVLWRHEDSGPAMPTLCQPRRRFCQLR
jgi:hypothetical protein